MLWLVLWTQRGRLFWFGFSVGRAGTHNVGTVIAPVLDLLALFVPSKVNKSPDGLELCYRLSPFDDTSSLSKKTLRSCALCYTVGMFT